MHATSQEGSSEHWRLTRDPDGIAWLTIDKAGASVNSLSRSVLEQFDEQLKHLVTNRPKGLIITSGKSGFIAGADIKEFTSLSSEAEAFQMIRAGQELMDRLASLPYPTVAAINGFALGGGLEVALACRYRVCVDDSSITLGFPEVQLGVHPGLGGTVRSVQLAGPIAAMDLMLTGRSIRPQQALKMGLVDKIVPREQLAEAARDLALNPRTPRQAGFKNALLNLAPIRAVIAGQMRTKVAKRAKPQHYPAPYKLVDLWQQYGGRGEAAMQAEARSMAHLLMTPTSRNLVRVFFLQERLKAGGKHGTEQAQHVHVVGAGVMGGDIASWCAARGMTVTLQDRGEEYVAPALARARAFFEKRYPDAAKRDSVIARLQGDVEGRGVAKADVVIEAIFENLDAKRELYARLEPQLKPTAVLATNTSSIVLEQLAEKLASPSRLIGLHFFNPVARMPLVEVIRTRESDAAMVQRGQAFARQIDKLAIPCRSAPGFLVNRVLMPYLSEAVRAAEEGISLALIDRAAEDFGMPMGPIELADVVGLDVVTSVGRVFFAEGDAPGILSTRVAMKHLGKKTGEGFYVWRGDKPEKPPTEGHRAPGDLQDRLMLALVNEAVAVLREQIVEDADLIDAGVIFGAGFAPFRGGPLQYARTRGVDAVVARLEELRSLHGDRFAPDAGWSLLR
jgi:3-hydroxyacyl-CoA dehydrogenase/enoyl-CoA hydratase/3-hydroxybutyryl-CoA epimerase